MKNYFDSETKVSIEGTPFNTKDAPTSKQLTSDCPVAGRKPNLFIDFPNGPKNLTLSGTRGLFIFPSKR